MIIADVLSLPELRRGLPEVVAGRDALDRDVRWVHAGEVANIASLLRGGEVLLTTGMGVGDAAADQRRFVAELDERGVAAIVIELGTVFPEVPEPIVTEAQRRGLPLVALRAEVPFVAVTEAAHTAIINANHAWLRDAEALSARFTDLMLAGGGVPEVLTSLAEAIGNPVVLERPDGGLRFSAAPADLPADLDPVAVWSRARGQAAVGTVVDVPGTAGGRLAVVPVLTEAGGFTRLALERAAHSVALAFLRSRQEDELLAFGRGDLLMGLVEGRLDGPAGEARARAMGFGEVTALLPLAARLSTGSWRPMLRDLERGLLGQGLRATVGLHTGSSDLLLLIDARGGEERGALCDRAANALVAAAARGGGAGPTVTAGATSDWSGVGASLRDALEALAPAAAAPDRLWHDAAAMPLERLLWQVRDRPEVARFAERLLAPLLAHDATSRHPLLPTLEALCAAGGHRAEAARRLHLNRQALYDRITRLERILDTNLADPANLLAFHLAVRIHRID